MAKQISNNVLVILISVTILVSLLGTWISLSKIIPITGLATGTANVTINETIGITMVNSNINFTTSNPGDQKDTYDTNDYTAGYGPFNITNDGAVTINITIQDTETLFTSASFSRALHYLYNVTHLLPGSGYIGNCSVGYGKGLALTGGWRAMPTSAEVAVCGLNFTDGSDSVLIHMNITVPRDEPAGVKGSTITFISSKAGV